MNLTQFERVKSELKRIFYGQNKISGKIVNTENIFWNEAGYFTFFRTKKRILQKPLRTAVKSQKKGGLKSEMARALFALPRGALQQGGALCPLWTSQGGAVHGYNVDPRRWPPWEPQRAPWQGAAAFPSLRGAHEWGWLGTANSTGCSPAPEAGWRRQHTKRDGWPHWSDFGEPRQCVERAREEAKGPDMRLTMVQSSSVN